MQQRLIRVELGLKKSFLLQKVRKIIPSGDVVIDQLWGGVGGGGRSEGLQNYLDYRTKNQKGDMNAHCTQLYIMYSSITLFFTCIT